MKFNWENGWKELKNLGYLLGIISFLMACVLGLAFIIVSFAVKFGWLTLIGLFLPAVFLYGATRGIDDYDFHQRNFPERPQRKLS